jgi:fructan beta-fructosidase
MSQTVYQIQRRLIALLTALSLVTACSPADIEEEVTFDASQINRHMETDVSFNERYRPQFHYTPKINWMNDPNGLVYLNGTFHLFHQYNPFGNKWGFMSWNHATSTDLVHWEHQPVAIPYGKEEEEAIYSGSAVVDHNNTSGFGNGTTAPIVAIYSSAYGGENPHQSQSLAYSTNGGETFQKYEGNPVLEFEDPDFRDPNVKWHEDIQKWIMVVALPLQHKVRFYSSDNLIDWEYLSDFGPAGAVSGIWECPDLFPLAVDGDPDNIKWVLHVDMNPGAIAGGSGSQYFVGDWDGETFVADDSISGGEIMWADYGTDYYAAISWNNVPEEDGRRLWLAWMNNWEYANEIPTDPWRSAMSIPRSVHLEKVGEKVAVTQRPVEELKTLRGNEVQLEEQDIAEGNHPLVNDGLSGKAYEVVVELEPGVSETAGLNVREGMNEETVIGYDAMTGTVFVDRTQSGENSFGDEFARRMDAPVRLIDGKVKLHIFVDWSSVEVFVNDGEQVITSRIFPDPKSVGLSLFADGGDASLASLTFWPLESIWD